MTVHQMPEDRKPPVEWLLWLSDGEQFRITLKAGVVPCNTDTRSFVVDVDGRWYVGTRHVVKAEIVHG